MAEDTLRPSHLRLEPHKREAAETGGSGGFEGTDEQVAAAAANLLAEADTLIEQEKWDEARQVLTTVVQRYRAAQNNVGCAEAMLTLGDVDLCCRHLQDAHTNYEQAVRLFRDAQRPDAQGVALLSVGDARRAMNRDADARDAYGAAARLFDKHSLLRGRADASFKLGDLLARTNPEMARQYLTRAESLYNQADQEAYPEPPIRIAHPHLPEPVGDCRRVESWIMAQVAARELVKLNLVIAAKPEVPEKRSVSAPEAAPKTARGCFREVLLASLGAACVIGFFRAVVILATTPTDGFIPYDQVLFAGLALLAVSGSMSLAALFKVRSRIIRIIAAAATFASTYQTASTLLGPRLVVTRSAVAAADDHAQHGILSSFTAPVQELAHNAMLRVRNWWGKDLPIDPERASYQRAIDTARQLGDPFKEAEALSSYAHFERRLGAVVEARRLYSEAVSAAARTNDAKFQGGLLLTQTRLELEAKSPQHAVLAARSAAELFQRSDDKRLEAKALRLVGDSERDLKRWQPARDAYEQSLARANLAQDRDAALLAMIHSARMERGLKRPLPARTQLSTAMRMSRDAKDDLGQARIWHEVGKVEADLSRSRPARTAYAHAAALYAVAGNKRGQAAVVRSLGHLERQELNLKDAAARFKESSELYGQARFDRGAAAATYYLGLVQKQQGQNDDAASSFTRSADLYQRAEAFGGAGKALMALADLHTEAGKIQPARSAYLKALSLSEARGDLIAQAAALHGLGKLLMDSDPNAARAYIARALTLTQSLSHSEASTDPPSATPPDNKNRRAS